MVANHEGGPMKAFVVYESLFGNTAAVGEALAASLRDRGPEVVSGPTTTIRPADVEGADLLVIGGPTHAHGMSRAATRKQAAQDSTNAFDAPTLDPGLREWIDALPPGEGRLAAAFDTRIDKPILLTGSAAKGIGRRLERRGYRLAAVPECFLVTTKNRLIDGEIDHAARWAAELAGAAEAPARR
jgi:hypothetical protein